MKKIFSSTLKFTGVFLLLFVVSFLIGAKAFSAEPTLLHLDFQDDQGQKVQVTRAILVLVVGNYVDKLALEPSTDGLDVQLDASWLRANWPRSSSRIKNLDRAYVYLKATGYASVCSNPIHWMGTESGGSGKSVVISFPRSKTMVVAKGEKLSSTVDFRRPTERFLKLSGSKGKPITGVRVKSYIYWSKDDDGDLSGADFLDEGTTDATGRVPVVDGDFTYAFKIIRKATPGNSAGTVLVVKRFEDKEYPATLQDDSAADSDE
jgi:hypothetical protein